MLVEMELREIIRGPESASFVLAEIDGRSREFPVVEIDLHQASCLEMAVHKIRAPRPLTHDLVLNVIEGLGGTLKRIIVSKLEHNTFYGKLDVQQKDHSTVWIDVRPSDAVVIASKVGVPIFVDEEVLKAVCPPMPPNFPTSPDPEDD